MTIDIRSAVGTGQAHVAGKFDAYMRLLAWENYMTRRRNRSRMERYDTCMRYYFGDNMPPGQFNLPLAINYLRVICEAHAAFLWGQWEPQNSILTWVVKPRAGKKGDKAQIAAMTDWIHELFEGYEDLLYSGALNQSIYGDGVLTPRWDPVHERIYAESVLPQFFHARWSPHNIAQINETVISYPITREDALAEFGVVSKEGASVPYGLPMEYALYWEWWTRTHTEVYVDNVLLDRRANPYSRGGLPGVVPFAHIPGVRPGGEFYGNSDIEPILELQDELNRKMADAGDIIAYNAHPIVLVRKYFGKVGDLPVGPDQVWDMGREGEAEYLSGDRPPVDINVYIDKLLQLLQDLTYLPKTAYGHSEESERSAISLAMKMIPTTNRVGWKRLLWRTSLLAYIDYAARLAEQHGALPFDRAYLARVLIQPQFAPILPKDRAAQIAENVSLVTNGMRSTRRALEDLGEQHVDDELGAIYADLRTKSQFMALNLGGKNQRGPGGSPDTGTEQKLIDPEKKVTG